MPGDECARSLALGTAGTASLGVGAALFAGLASACCVGPVAAPLVVAILGAGGAAWAAGLKPYSMLILVLSGALLAFSVWSLRQRGAGSCEPADRPRSRLKERLARGIVGGATLLWLVSLALNLYLS